MECETTTVASLAGLQNLPAELFPFPTAPSWAPYIYSIFRLGWLRHCLANSRQVLLTRKKKTRPSLGVFPSVEAPLKVRRDFSRRHTAHFVPTPPAILRKIPPTKSINIPNALIQSSQNKCINPFTPQLLVTLLIHNAFSIHYGYTLMFSLLKILDRHRTTTNRHDRLPTSPQLLSFDIVCAD